MNVISNKDKIKDFLILSLIETIADLFTINYNIENFQVGERGTLEDVIEAGAFQATMDDAEPERDNLL